MKNCRESGQNKSDLTLPNDSCAVSKVLVLRFHSKSPLPFQEPRIDKTRHIHTAGNTG